MNLGLLSLLCATSDGSAAAVQVYHAGEGGFQCIRAPATIAVQGGVLLAFAAGRCFTGDNCYPLAPLPAAATTTNNYSAHVVKRSTDGGRTWGALVELHRSLPSPGCAARNSPEGAPFFDARTNTTLALWRMENRVGNATTGLALWQAESRDAGLTWSAPRPVVIPGLLPAQVTNGTHLPPGTGIQLRAAGGEHPGRLLCVLILQKHCTEDVVIFSDDGGGTWALSGGGDGGGALRHNGEAQVAELAADTVLFNGRSGVGKNARGVATSADGGTTFGPVRFAQDESGGVSCLASVMALPTEPAAAAVAAAAAAATPALAQPNCSAAGYRRNTTAKRSAVALRDFPSSTTADPLAECCAACANHSAGDWRGRAGGGKGACSAWTVATAHATEPHKATTCYLLGELTAAPTACAWCTSGVGGGPPPPPPPPSPAPAPAGSLAPLLFSHPSAPGRATGVLLRSDDGAQSWTEVASATPEEPTAMFGYSSLVLLPQSSGSGSGTTTVVGLSYETADDAYCTADTSACRIMYRTIAVPLKGKAV
jgi:hypothetical protein